jgi:hypothetical protein
MILTSFSSVPLRRQIINIDWGSCFRESKGSLVPQKRFML